MFSSLPLRLLNESRPFVVTIETKNGEKYRGKLIQIEDTMNFYLENIFIQEKNGKTRKCQSIFLRGNTIKLIILPDILKNSSILKKN